MGEIPGDLPKKISVWPRDYFQNRLEAGVVIVCGLSNGKHNLCLQGEVTVILCRNEDKDLSDM